MIGLGVGAAAVAVVVALVASLVIPPVLTNNDSRFWTAPDMARTPQLLLTWDSPAERLLTPGVAHRADSGILVTDSDEQVTVYRVERHQVRKLWQAGVPGRCGTGTRGALTCVDGTSVTLYDLRTGDQTRRYALPTGLNAIIESLQPLPDGGLAVPTGVPNSIGGHDTTGWARLDAQGRVVWKSSLPSGNWYWPVLHGEILLVDRADSRGNNPRVSVARSLADGQPLKGVPDAVPMAKLPGEELLAGGNPALVVNGDGAPMMNLPGRTPLGLSFSSDGSLRAYATQDDPKAPTVIWNADGDRITRDLHLSAVCNGVLLGSPMSSIRDYIGYDRTGSEVLRFSAAAQRSSHGSSFGCDGKRFIELAGGEDSNTAVLRARDRSGQAWEHRLSAPGEYLGGFITAEGVLVFSRQPGADQSVATGYFYR